MGVRKMYDELWRMWWVDLMSISSLKIMSFLQKKLQRSKGHSPQEPLRPTALPVHRAHTFNRPTMKQIGHFIRPSSILIHLQASNPGPLLFKDERPPPYVHPSHAISSKAPSEATLSLPSAVLVSQRRLGRL